ncbi:MAG: RNase adapter RapZ [Deltaproteobacteria bacterium]|nr:RNase adapter RapZ [Deltaproteobacteria bacterium]
MRIVVVTGMSGAGKSTALKALEDLGFYCADNLPMPLLKQFVELLGQIKNLAKVALVVDARAGEFLGGFQAVFEAIRSAGHTVEVLFLDAPDQVLLRRFSETRRRHPLGGDDLRKGIDEERRLLGGLHDYPGAAVVNTDGLNVHQLKGIVQERYGKREGALGITLLSFGFKLGLPPEADVVFDVRFLPNPYFEPTLTSRTGLETAVQDFVLGSPDAEAFLGLAERMLRFTIPRYEREGKAYLTIAIGCTGGRHRSVSIVEELARRLGAVHSITVRHRDLEPGS